MKFTRLHVKSVNDYFNLPKKEREEYGFYKVPFSLPWSIYEDTDGWGAFYERLATEYPIQFFFRVWLFSFSNPVYAFVKQYICWPLDNLKSNLRNLQTPCHPRWRKTLPRHKYCDIVNLIVDSNFNLLLDFYYEEVLNGCVDWDADEVHRVFHSRLVESVTWIEQTQKELIAKSDDALSRATNDKDVKSYEEKYKEYNELEKQIEDKKTDILTWMIKNREFFWT